MFAKKSNAETPDAGAGRARGGGQNAGPDEDLHEQVLRLTTERDEAVAQMKRAMADFQNYQSRALKNEQEAKRQGVTGVVMSVLPVLDHFDLALAQPATDEAARKILDGVKVIRQELIRALETHGVTLISPQANDVFDPNRHSAIMQQSGPGVAPGHVSATFQPGYSLGERVIRSAKVAVAPGDAEPAPSSDSDDMLGRPNERGEYTIDE